MLTRMRSAVSSLMGGIMAPAAAAAANVENEDSGGANLAPRFPYCRAEFLELSADELECGADHINRPVLTVKESGRLPWSTGYAEVINAGKSALNEDQACCEVVELRKRPADPASPSYTPTTRRRASLPTRESLESSEDCLIQDLSQEEEDLYFHYWGLFDGHAGSGAAVFASKLLHLHIEEQLQSVLEILQKPSMQPPTCLGEETSLHVRPSGSSQRALSRAASLRGAAGAPGSPNTPTPRFFMEKKVKQESLVVGAIENAFKEVDKHIGRERGVYDISGGCTALVAMHLLGKLYVANAGDSRAIILRTGEILPMSSAFTPETERQRLQCLAYMQPHLLGNEFTHLEFPRTVCKKEVGKRMLYRDYTMKGWAYKTVQEDDLKFPLVFGEGKKARLMATIGVTRGFGDHDLKVHGTDISIKPFLLCNPEVRVYNLEQFEHGPDDVMVLATDGLWDVLSNKEVAEAVTSFLGNSDPDNHHRYTMAAQELVTTAKGIRTEQGWRTTNGRLGSVDDISVYIIPLMFGNTQPQSR
ncbi:protein phosphatase 1H [Clarias gariepinus]|uniref:protein phosphatase 1H n=1 Tax=Clarias gariepinus TaxID=13013 RepID=UPI00234CD377|nr:protein phosphatase 1H [Clarias gariepinus]